MEQAIGIFAQRIAALNDEPGHHTVEGGAVIKADLDEIEQVLDMAWGRIRIETNLDVAEPRRNRDARVLLLKLQCHGLTVSRQSAR